MRRTVRLVAGIALLTGCGGESTPTERAATIRPRDNAALQESPAAVQKDLATLRQVTAAFHTFETAQACGVVRANHGVHVGSRGWRNGFPLRQAFPHRRHGACGRAGAPALRAGGRTAACVSWRWSTSSRTPRIPAMPRRRCCSARSSNRSMPSSSGACMRGSGKRTRAGCSLPGIRRSAARTRLPFPPCRTADL